MKAEFYTESGVKIAGILNPLPVPETRMAELLYKHRPQWVATEVIQQFTGRSRRSLRCYAVTLNSIFNLYGWKIEGRPRRDGAYRLTRKDETSETD